LEGGVWNIAGGGDRAVGSEERKRKERRKGREKKRTEAKNVENFPNLKIFGGENKRQFMRLV
jgi:hypothetical protein